LKQENNNQYP